MTRKRRVPAPDARVRGPSTPSPRRGRGHWRLRRPAPWPPGPVAWDMVARAAALGARTVCVTFDPDPAQVLHPTAPRALVLHAEREQLIRAAGVDEVFVWAFTPR